MNKNRLFFVFVAVLIISFTFLQGVRAFDNETFKFHINTNSTSIGSTNSSCFKIPLESTGTYNFIVSWGDNTTNTITTWNDANATHCYNSTNPYWYVYILMPKSINMTLNGWRFNNGGDRLKIDLIDQWGNIQLGNTGGYFFGANNMLINATDKLDLSNTSYMFRAFRDCYNLGYTDGFWGTNPSNFSNWNTSTINNLQETFMNALNFEGDLNDWDVSNVNILRSTFFNAKKFNNNLSKWNTSKVTTLQSTFAGASNFNQNLCSWDTSNVNVMFNTFSQAFKFDNLNVSLNCWSTNNLTNGGLFSSNIFGMFTSTAYNKSISGWNISRVGSLDTFFYNASYTLQDLDAWDTSNIKYMNFLFENNHHLNNTNITYLSKWNYSNVTEMSFFLGDVYIVGNDTYDERIKILNYDELLNRINETTTKNNVVFGGGLSTYSQYGNASRYYLVNVRGWNITDGGFVYINPPSPSFNYSYINPCNTSYTLNLTGQDVYFNFSSNYDSDLVLVRDLVNEVVLGNTSGFYNLNSSDFLNGVYSPVLRFNSTDYTTGCSLSLCKSNYVANVNPCVNGQKLISYNDTNNCIPQYDKPANDNTSTSCVVSSTDKELWLIILLFALYVVLLILTVIYPLASVGLLIISIFMTIQFLSYFTDASLFVGLLFPILAVIVGGFAIVLRSGR